jgi:hypothetical protein
MYHGQEQGVKPPAREDSTVTGIMQKLDSLTTHFNA